MDRLGNERCWHEAFGVGLSITTRRPTVRRLDGA
jgi:hypothetical protein